MGIYSGVGGYNFVPRVSCLSDVRLDRRPISEKQQTPQARLGGVIIGLHKCIDVDLVFLGNMKCILNSMGLYSVRGAYKRIVTCSVF